MDSLGRNDPQPLLGLDSHEDWALVGPWLTDRSYIRNAYVYALSNRIGRWAPRTRFVETFINQNGDGLDAADYYGIGVLTDRIKVSKDRVDLATLDPSDNSGNAVTGGYVVKLDIVPDTGHYNFYTDRGIPTQPNTAVVIDTPNLGDLTQPQRTYIRDHVQQMENSLYASRALEFGSRPYLDYIDVPSWVDHHILELFSGNVDALYRSEYFSKDRGGKLVSGPVWDFDGSMGNGDNRNAAWDTWNTAGNVDLWNYGWFGVLTHDPEFMQAWIDRWQALRRNEFSDQNLNGLADSLAAEIGPEAAARDAARWVDNQGPYPGGFVGEIAHLKDWMTRRAAWIGQQFVAAPTAAGAGNSLTFTAAVGAQLAYTLDGSDPRSLGGAVAPNTVLTSAPLVVPATANVHARSYRADFVNKFPGRPWSSVAVGANSSPLVPRGRLINLSSRAVIGAGDSTLIAGVVVADTAAKNFLARAVGPGLTAFGVSGALPDPVLQIYADNGAEIYRNSSWQTSPDAAKLPSLSTSVGAFALAAGSIDAALVSQFASRSYTVKMSSVTGKSGGGLVELYELDATGRAINLSTRGLVRTGDGVLFGGFVVQGPAYKRLLIRGIGPTLAAFGIVNALADPVLTIFSGQTVVTTNDDWASGGNATAVAASAKTVGAFTLVSGSKDAALLVTLPPGAYTVQVSGKNGAEGVALFEIYDVP